MQVHGSYQDDPREESSAQEMGETQVAMGKSKDEVEPSSQAMVTTGTGLAALPKKLVSKILVNEYIDFTVLPPAKGKAHNVPQSLEGQVLVVQAAHLMQAQKLILDLAAWVRFALYATTLLTHQPNRVSEMMAYQSIIARANAKYRWPS